MTIHRRGTDICYPFSVDTRTRATTLRASGGQVLTFTGSPEQEREIRKDERRFIGSLLRAAISEGQAVELQRALAALGEKDAPRTAGTLVHLLASLLGDESQEEAA